MENDIVANAILNLEHAFKWAEKQNWVYIYFVISGVLNNVAIGTKIMGWTKISDFCGKLEDALTAMAKAWITRKKSNGDDTNRKENAK